MDGTAEAIFKLKLLVDKKKNKVVFAETDKGFVDVLFSLLTLPMGTIVRLLEKHQQNQKSQAVSIGCFNNVYRSVVDLGTASFMTKTCREMLLHPRSEKEDQRRNLRLNIDNIAERKYYKCTSSCLQAYSNFWSSRCRCGELMAIEFERHRGVASGDIFVSDKSFFTITDDLRVEFISTGLTLKILKELGYTDVDQLHEMLVDVKRKEVLALLQCLFNSDTPFTDVFLTKGSSSGIGNPLKMPIHPFREEITGETESNEVISVTVFTRKLDNKVLYVERGKDFVDLLFTFLVLPLKSAWEMSGRSMVLGCIGNLYDSFKKLSSGEEKNALTNTCILPWYYSCQRLLLDVGYAKRDSDHRVYVGNNGYNLKAMDPRCNSFDLSTLCSGFVKEGETFMISDDLIITPVNFSVTISTLKKWNMDLDDIEGQVINISKAEAIGLLRASFMTSAALSTVFGRLLGKKPKEEKL